MPNIQSAKDFSKKPGFILALILAGFFFKGVFVATLFPIFTGQDEARHYNTVQFLAEPKEKTWPMTPRPIVPDKATIADYNFSEEIREAGAAADFDLFRHAMYDTSAFSDSNGYDGKNETLINSGPWKPYNYLSPPDTAGKSLYHRLASLIEKSFASQNILFRFFSVRIFSVLLGTLTVLFAYLIMINIGIRPKESLIMTAIIAFQPKLSMYTTNINYDVLLIPLFALFTLGAVLSLKKGLDWKNVNLMVISIILGMLTKGTAIVMLAVFLGLTGFHLYQKIKHQNKFLIAIALPLLLLVFGFLVPRVTIYLGYNLVALLPFKGSLTDIFLSLQSYLGKSLTMGRFALSSRTYWGSLGWEDNWLSQNFTDIIKLIEAFSLVGLGMYFFSKKQRPEYLPEKKYVLFLITMIVALQLGIRFYDWKLFMQTGSLDLCTPGRYFLPNLAGHIILVFTGLGMLFRKENYFKNSLLTGLILMFSFSLYLIFNVVLPRYYF